MIAPTDSYPPLDIAVVGHTNVGKTSLLRTLLRQPDFGQVCDSAGTTRHVERTEVVGFADVVHFDEVHFVRSRPRAARHIPGGGPPPLGGLGIFGRKGLDSCCAGAPGEASAAGAA